PDETLPSLAELPMRGDPVVGTEHVGPVGRKDDGSSARGRDELHCAGVRVEVEGRARVVRDERAAHEPGGAREVGGDVEHAGASVTIEKLHIAGVHVDGRSQPGAHRLAQQSLVTGPVDVTRCSERQQDRGDPEDRPTGPERGRRYNLGCHAHVSSTCPLSAPSAPGTRLSTAPAPAYCSAGYPPRGHSPPPSRRTPRGGRGTPRGHRVRARASPPLRRRTRPPHTRADARRAEPSSRARARWPAGASCWRWTGARGDSQCGDRSTLPRGRRSWTRPTPTSQ